MILRSTFGQVLGVYLNERTRSEGGSPRSRSRGAGRGCDVQEFDLIGESAGAEAEDLGGFAAVARDSREGFADQA